MQRKKILILLGVFFATLPVSYYLGLYTAYLLGLPIAFVLHSLGVYWVTVAHIAYWWSIILTSLFFTYIAWLFIDPIENPKNRIPIVVFLAALPVSLIISGFTPPLRLLYDVFSTRIGWFLANLLWVLLFTVAPSLFLAFLARFLLKSKKNPNMQTE